MCIEVILLRRSFSDLIAAKCSLQGLDGEKLARKITVGESHGLSQWFSKIFERWCFEFIDLVCDARCHFQCRIILTTIVTEI